MSENKPDFTKPVDVMQFIYNTFHPCGCSDRVSVLQEVRGFLFWLKEDSKDRVRYDSLFRGFVGIFYIMAGICDRAYLCGHGGGIRNAWIEPLGRELLHALETIPLETIAEAEGEAYDGIYVQ